MKKRNKKHEQPARMEHGREDRRNIVFVQTPRHDSVNGVPYHLSMRKNRAFGSSGCARGIQDTNRVIPHNGRTLWFSGRGLVDQFFVGFSGNISTFNRNEMIHLDGVFHFVIDRNEFRTDDQHLGLTVIEDIDQFTRGQAPIQRRKDRANLRHTEQQVHIGNCVVRQNGHTVTFLYTACFLQEVRGAIGALIQLRIGVMDSSRKFDQRLAVRGQQGSFGEDIGRIHRFSVRFQVSGKKFREKNHVSSTNTLAPDT